MADRPDGLNLSGRTLLISEEALRTEVGHFYEYNRAVVDIAEAAGARAIVAVHREANARVLSGLPACAVYPRTSWGTIHAEPNALKRYAATIGHNFTVARTMSRLLSEMGPVDTVFAPTVTAPHVLGWRLFAARHLGRDVRRLVLLWRNNVARYEEGATAPGFSAAARAVGRVLKSFRRWQATDAYTFATDSERLADQFEALTGDRPDVFPSPRVAPLPPPRSPRAPGEPVVFSCLGPARFEKGIDVLQRAATALVERPPEAPFELVVQWNQEIVDAAGEPFRPDPRLVADLRVRYLTEEMSSREYDAVLHGTDCMVLPYRLDSYHARISGVAVEAVTAGIPLIYTDDTWCEGLVRTSGAGIGVRDGDDAALAEAMRTMAREIASYRAEAEAATARARAANAPATFNRLLWGIGDGSPR